MSTKKRLIVIFDPLSGRDFSGRVVAQMEPDAEVVRVQSDVEAQQLLESSARAPDIYLFNAPRMKPRAQGKAQYYPLNLPEQVANIAMEHQKRVGKAPTIYLMFNYLGGNGEASNMILAQTGFATINLDHIPSMYYPNDPKPLSDYIAKEL